MSLNQSGLENTEEVQSGASVEQPSESNNEETTTPVEGLAVPAASEAPASEIDAPAASDDAVSASDVPATETPVETTSSTPAVGSSQLKRGDLVEGVIKSTSPTQILVDVGTPNDGVILADEMFFQIFPALLAIVFCKFYRFSYGIIATCNYPDNHSMWYTKGGWTF